MSDGAPALTKLQWQKRLRGAGLTPAEYMVLVTLSTYADRHLRNARPGWARMVNDTGLDLRTIKKAVSHLLGKEYLVLTEPGGNQYGKGRANVYELTLPVVHKGDTAGAPSDGAEGARRGTSGAARGADDVDEGVHGMTPHQGYPSGHQIHHSADKSQRVDAAEPPDADDDDIGLLEDWLVDQLGPLSAPEYQTAAGMWEGGEHPHAIRNTIQAGRDPWAATRRTA